MGWYVCPAYVLSVYTFVLVMCVIIIFMIVPLFVVYHFCFVRFIAVLYISYCPCIEYLQTQVLFFVFAVYAGLILFSRYARYVDFKTRSIVAGVGTSNCYNPFLFLVVFWSIGRCCFLARCVCCI